MELREGASGYGGVGRGVGVQDDSHHATRFRGVGAERRREGVIHNVDIRSVGRDSRSRVVAAIASGLDVPWSRPGGAAVRGLAEHYMR